MLPLLLYECLKLCVLGGTGERNHVPDIGHTGNEKEQSLKSQSETGMGAGPVFTGIEIPPHVFHWNVEFLDTCHQFVIVFFTHATADD